MLIIKKIISGGQTGADRGGLDAAIALEIPHGGYCPRGRRAEDGCIPDKYEQVESYSTNYAVRTEQNIKESDCTIIFCYGYPTGGSLKTVQFAQIHQKPYLTIDLSQNEKQITSTIQNWLKKLTKKTITINIAGSRASNNQQNIQEQTNNILQKTILNMLDNNECNW